MTTNFQHCEIEQLKEIPGNSGTHFAISNECIAIAAPQCLTVWKNAVKIFEVNAAKTILGYPQFTSTHVLWGNIIVEISSGKIEYVERIEELMIEGTTVFPNPSPMGSYSVVSFTWSPDGEIFVLTLNWHGQPGPPFARALLADKKGKLLKIIWEGNDIAPQAVYISKNWIILGTREPIIFNCSGEFIKKLPQDIPALRMETSDDENILMEMEPGQIKIWDIQKWELKICYPGLWTDASISSDGKTILATGFWGKLFCLDTTDSTSVFEEIKMKDLVQNVTIENERFVASFLSGEKVRTGLLKK